MLEPLRGASALAIVLLAGIAAADEPAHEARLSCRREASPGRVSCELEVEVTNGRLAWADALVVDAPKLARPLRARVGPKSATAAGPRRLRLPLALAATEAGRGELVVEARAVTCRATPGGRELCRAWARVVKATVEVGAVEQGGR